MGRKLSDCDTSLTPSGREREERLGGSILVHYVVPWRVLQPSWLSEESGNPPPHRMGLTQDPSVMAWAPTHGHHTEDELREVLSSFAIQ